VVGDLVGEGASQEEAVVGETPNLAARLQGLVEAGGVVVAEPTRRLLGEVFDLADFGRLELKGFSTPVRAWRVIGERPAKSRFEAAHPTGMTQLISRQHELSLLLDRWTEAKALLIVAAEADGTGIGRIRMRRLPAVTRAAVHGFIRAAVDPGSTVRTDGLHVYRGLEGYRHAWQVQREQPAGAHLLPRVHRAVSLLKRWLLGTHQGAIGHAHLDYYLDEFTFRFNRRKSASRGKLFYRLAQQAVQVDPVPLASLSNYNG